MKREENTGFTLEAAYGLAAVEAAKKERMEREINERMERGEDVEPELLTDYAKVANSYCNALDLLENYPKEQQQYEKVLALLTDSESDSMERINVTLATYLKYAGVLWKQNKYKKTGEALKEALGYMISNIENLDAERIDKKTLTTQIQHIS